MAGSGGDELFAGYPWRYYRAMNSQNFEHYIDEYYLYWQRLVDNRDLKKIFTPIWSDVSHVWTRDIFRDVFSTHENELNSPQDYINHSLYFEAKTFLHGIFVVEDKLSMTHGLENRVPFMDNDLVDFAMQCPVQLKLNQLAEVERIDENLPGDKQRVFFHKTNDGKQLLREIMARYIPEEITKAEKQGFSSPDASWFKGESIDFVKQKLSNPKSQLYEFFDPKIIRLLVEDHFNGKQNRRLFIWSLLNLETWIQEYL